VSVDVNEMALACNAGSSAVHGHRRSWTRRSNAPDIPARLLGHDRHALYLQNKKRSLIIFFLRHVSDLLD
jgi:hypothetical protein